MVGFFDGGTYLVHLRSRHHQLQESAQRVVQAFADTGEPKWQPNDRLRIFDCISELHECLASHVQSEDMGGYIDEAASRLPRLSGDAERLYCNNRRLLRELSDIADMVMYGPRTDAENAFARFARSLYRQERKEERLLEKGLNKLPIRER